MTRIFFCDQFTAIGMADQPDISARPIIGRTQVLNLFLFGLGQPTGL